MDFPEYIVKKTAELIPYARNSRLHSDEQVAQIAASIKEFGFLNPIIVDGSNGIIAGHGRVMAAQLIGMDALPCVEASHLTDAQRRAYVIADNKIALNSEWDNDLLMVEIADLQELDFEIEVLGFNTDELSVIFSEPDDIETVDQFNDTFNFSIKCDDLIEMGQLQSLLGVGGKRMDAKKLIELLS